jgi:LCP family protein required for cell wall assembly
MSSPDSPSDDGSTSPDPELDVDAEVPADAVSPVPGTPDEATHDEQVDAPEPEPDTEPDTEPESEPEVEPESEVDEAAVAAAPVLVVRPSMGKPRRRKRSWGQRVLLVVNSIVIIACFAAAVGLLISRHYGNSIARVDINDSPTLTTATDANGSQPLTTAAGVTSPVETGPVETFPAVDPGAKNFLITGADNNACIDPNSKYAPAFGDRETMGERSDTIMIMRVDPDTRRAAVLSFPRDLWVQIAGRTNKNRINSAYVRNEPQKLIDTIYQNFGVGVDHFIQVDFCAFKTMVDAVGGVTVPFEYPARDTHTGLYVPEPGCFTFDGEHALAYVRSRHYQYFVDGKWKEDPASDLGRVSRQQDFLRRVLASALAKGFDPGFARNMIDAVQDYVVVDSELTISKMLEFAGILTDFEPGEIATYQIEAYNDTISGNAVLVPRIKGDNMQAILAIFKGEAPLAGAPAQVFDTTTSSTEVGDTAVPGTVVGPEENVIGIVPPDVDC